MQELKTLEYFSNWKATHTGKVRLVKFSADWCGPCKKLTPLVDTIAAKYAGSIACASVNVKDANQLCKHFGVSSVPLCVIFEKDDGKVTETTDKDQSGGQEPHRILGYHPNELIELLKKSLCVED